MTTSGCSFSMASATWLTRNNWLAISEPSAVAQLLAALAEAAYLDVVLGDADDLGVGIVPQHLAHVIDRDLHHLGMRGAELGGGARAVGLLREVVRVVLEVLVRRQHLAGGVDEHAGVIHVAALFLGHGGVGGVGAIAQRPDRVEGAGVERVADLQLRNVAAGDRRDDQRVGLGQADGIVGVEAAAEVLLQQRIDGVDRRRGSCRPRG